VVNAATHGVEMGGVGGLTIGDTVITDGVITDTTGLSIVANTAITGTLTTGRIDATGDATAVFRGYQSADSKGFYIYGFDNRDADFFSASVDQYGRGVITTSRDMLYTANSGLIDFLAGAADIRVRPNYYGDAGAGKFYVGDPSGATVFSVDTLGNMSVTGIAALGDGTNYTQISATGNITQAGSATATLGRTAFATATIHPSGQTDDIDVSGINVLFIDADGANPALISGFTGGVAGQVLYASIIDHTKDVTMQHLEGASVQDLYLHDSADETLDNFGGWTFTCDGTNWHDVSHARHV